MTYDFTVTVENITPAQAKALFDALVLLLAPYPDSTAGYHEASEDSDKSLFDLRQSLYLAIVATKHMIGDTYQFMAEIEPIIKQAEAQYG